jgi:pSer/pThr/pTyr-binding forkhead associated (FHA) protein
VSAGVAHTLVAPVIDATPANQVTARLRVLEGPASQVGTEVSVRSRDVRLGRDPNWASVLFYRDEQSTVSGQHCILTLKGGQLFVTDNGSTNGTFVNGQRLEARQPTELQDGDELELGNLNLKGVRLQVMIGTAPSAPAASQGSPLDRGDTKEENDIDDEIYSTNPMDIRPPDDDDSAQRGGNDDNWMSDLG